MDNNTYLESGVAAFYNRQFVSIRVQCDTGKSDDPHVKSWYADARELIRRYRVYKYPCFLFFSPKGEPLNIGFGAKAPDDFVSLGKDALNPQRQYFSLLRRVSAGYMDTSACPYLIQTAEEMGEHEVARTIAKKYIDSFWIQLPEREKWTKNNLFFLTYCFGQKFIGSNDSAFKAFYNNQAKVGEVTGDVQLARRYIEYVVSVEYVDPALAGASGPPVVEPKWIQIDSAIRKDFNESIAEKEIAFGKDRWYNHTRNWIALMENKTMILSTYSVDVSDLDMNNQAWAIFLRCSDRRVLDSAVKWSAHVLKDTSGWTDGNMPNYIDTYASLLYKVGRINDAIYWEQMACKHDPKNQEFHDRLELMRQRKLTW